MTTSTLFIEYSQRDRHPGLVQSIIQTLAVERVVRNPEDLLIGIFFTSRNDAAGGVFQVEVETADNWQIKEVTDARFFVDEAGLPVWKLAHEKRQAAKSIAAWIGAGAAIPAVSF